MLLHPHDTSVRYLAVDLGLGQLLAFQLVHTAAGRPVASDPVPPPPATATPETHRAWVARWARHRAVLALAAVHQPPRPDLLEHYQSTVTPWEVHVNAIGAVR